MATRPNHRRTVKRIALFMTIAACVLIIAMMFIAFCMMEALYLLFAGGAFTFVFPAIATAVMVIGMLAVAIVGGGAA